MNTKEMMDFLQNLKYHDYDNELIKNKLCEVQRQLECGEKYEQMWEDFKDRCGGCEMMNYVGKVRIMREVLKDYEQKYFPNLICGNCKNYNSDTLFCDEHPEYGELVEQDTCSDWKEDE